MRTKLTDGLYFSGLGAFMVGDTIYEGFGAALILTGLFLMVTSAIIFFMERPHDED